MKFHIPPKYNRDGNHQMLLVETENESVNDVINGLLFALLVFVPLSLFTPSVI